MVGLTHRELASDGRDGKGWAKEGWAEDRATAPCGGPTMKCRNVARCDWPRQRLNLLTQTIEQEIVPRLVLARSAGTARPVAPPAGTAPVSAEEVEELARLSTGRDPSAANRLVAAVLARGTPIETLYLELLAPAARRLGEQWSDDQCDFTQVTMGLWCLHELLRQTGNDLPDPAGRRAGDRSILLVPVPGEQHTFGLAMVASFFRRAGWSVWSEPLACSNDLVGIVRSEWFAVVGFSLSCATRMEALATNIRRVRRASRNPAVGILVGGPVFQERPELVVMAGADATAFDGRQAILQAESLVAMRAAGD